MCAYRKVFHNRHYYATAFSGNQKFSERNSNEQMSVPLFGSNERWLNNRKGWSNGRQAHERQSHERKLHD